MGTLAAFIKETGITLRSRRVEVPADADEWGRGATHWSCTLRCDGRSMTVPFHQGSAHKGEPQLSDVLDCMASDAAGFENARSIQEWAREYGYDTDSRKAERTYRTVEKQAGRLKSLLGADVYERLLWDTERE